ncbi:NAD-dependent epimerase/dehydratase family protein [Amphibacillus jilinensis]|uniref:NAD-dependent epimerase/dehydratase family protein n=1 Tax=Amphibacillus jilinensis TaxID=1216008 RepID=UPI0002DCC24F|nr:NAD(P)-dependent oxidoreductase [Amphibacillus jilinensis]
MEILLTGAAGAIGSSLTYGLKDKYSLTLTDIDKKKLTKLNNNFLIEELDINDAQACKSLFSGIDVVIHLAGNPNPEQNFESILESNIKGTYNVFKAAVDNKVKKVIFASSAQTIEAYPVDVQLSENDPVRPKNLYGVSKVFCESLASYFSYEYHIPFIALRIGAFDEVKKYNKSLNARDMSAYLSPEDLVQLVDKCISIDIGNTFEIINAISNNKYKRLDIQKAKEKLNYSPISDAFKECGFTFDN